MLLLVCIKDLRQFPYTLCQNLREIYVKLLTVSIKLSIIESREADDMAQTNVNIRMDEDLKKQFDAFCVDIGMNMTTAFCVFAKTAVRERRIPFEISAKTDPFYSPTNMERLRKSVAQMEATGGTIHEVEFDD